MKVQVNSLGVRFSSLSSGSTFVFSDKCYLKTSLVTENMYYAVELECGTCTVFFDDTLVYPTKLMVVPEK